MDNDTTMTSSNQPENIADFLDNAIVDLKRKSRNLTFGGIAVFVLAIVIAILLFYDIKVTTLSHLVELNQAGSATHTLIYLVVRSAALGTVATTTLIFLVKTALACFDQSTRFAKRRYGALFLQFIYQKHDQTSLQENITIEEIMKFFDAWNKNIESAFSSVKIGKRGNDPMELSMDKDGAKFKIGEPSK